MERKLRDKELAYQELLKKWEQRERKKSREHEKERDREEDRKMEEVRSSALLDIYNRIYPDDYKDAIFFNRFNSCIRND